MTDDVVVLGSGYAGTGAVQRLEQQLGDTADLTWVSNEPYHFVLHEAHRCISDPSISDRITFPIERLKSPATRFLHGQVSGVTTGDQTVHFDDGSTLSFDYLLVCIGTRTAFFGIDGIRRHSITLKSRPDALEIHDAVREAAKEASREDPAQIVIGGAGLSGIQTAGEVARFRDRRPAPLTVHLVEGLDSIYPGNDPVVQARLRKKLGDWDVNVMTGEFVTQVDAETISIGDEDELPYDVLLWTGGITGRAAASQIEVDRDERTNRIYTEATFQTEAPRVFAIGDAALIDQPAGDPAPPTAQAAWQAADVAAQNIVRAVRGQPLQRWTYDDKGTVISVGDDALAHGVDYLPVDSFDGRPAELLKKSIAARWITSIAGPRSAAKAWPDL